MCQPYIDSATASMIVLPLSIKPQSRRDLYVSGSLSLLAQLLLFLQIVLYHKEDTILQS